MKHADQVKVNPISHTHDFKQNRSLPKYGGWQYRPSNNLSDARADARFLQSRL